jgi:hypothetical protein
MDEKPFQLPGEVRESIPMKPGKVEKVDGEYRREGACSIFIFTEPLASWRYAEAFKQRTKKDWALLGVRYSVSGCGESGMSDG